MDNEDPTRESRGCLVGLVLGVPVWAVAIWLAVKAVRGDW